MKAKFFIIIFFITITIFAQTDSTIANYQLLRKQLINKLDQTDAQLYRLEKQRNEIIAELQKIDLLIEEKKRGKNDTKR